MPHDVEISHDGIRFTWRGPMVTPFSNIDLHNRHDHNLSVNTMEVEFEEAVLVIRGRVNGKEAEIMVGNLDSTGPDNGIVLLETQRHETFAGRDMLRTLSLGSEYRLLVDCALEPDKNGHAYTVRLREANS